MVLAQVLNDRPPAPVKELLSPSSAREIAGPEESVIRVVKMGKANR